MAFIRLRNLSVEFPIYQGGSQSLKKMLVAATTYGNLARDAMDRINVRALNDVTLDIEDGDRLGLIGPNGAGKTTLLSAVAGLMSARGVVTFDGLSCLGAPPRLTAERRALMLNATAEGLPLYEKLGFISTGLVRQHQGRLSAPPPAPDVPLRQAVPSDRVALCALDAAVFGADRSALIGSLLASGDAWLVDRAGQPAGFAIRRAFGRGTIIGPVVASNDDEAIALVAAAAKAAPPGVLRMDIPASAEGLAAWLTTAGLPAIDTVTVMLRASWPPIPKEPQRFGLALQAWG